MERVSNGSEEAAREVVERYGDALQRAIRRALRPRLRCMFDPEDFAQMVWLSFFRRKDEAARFNSPEELMRFVLGMAKKKIAAQARARVVRPQHNLNRERSLETWIKKGGDLAEQRPATAESLAEREQCDKFLSALPERQRQIVELRLQGLQKTEVAKRLGIAERTLRHSWKKLVLFWKKFFPRERIVDEERSRNS